MQGKEGKSISEALQGILGQLSFDQIRFVVARQECATDREAARAIGIQPNTVAKWRHRGTPIALALEHMAMDSLTVATEIRRQALTKAMMVKIKGLDHKSAQIAQKAATEIIEWEMGRAVQRQEHKHEGTVDIAMLWPEDAHPEDH